MYIYTYILYDMIISYTYTHIYIHMHAVELEQSCHKRHTHIILYIYIYLIYCFILPVIRGPLFAIWGQSLTWGIAGNSLAANVAPVNGHGDVKKHGAADFSAMWATLKHIDTCDALQAFLFWQKIEPTTLWYSWKKCVIFFSHCASSTCLVNFQGSRDRQETTRHERLGVFAACDSIFPMEKFGLLYFSRLAAVLLIWLFPFTVFPMLWLMQFDSIRQEAIPGDTKYGEESR